jgi:hypothetical protein
MNRRAALVLAVALVSVGPRAQEAPTAAPTAEQATTAEQALMQALEAGGIRFEPHLGRCSVEATVATRDDLIEFLLVGQAGAAYESLLQTAVDPALLNAALLSLGLEPGANARWELVDVEGGGDSTAPELAPGQRADAAGEWLGGREYRVVAPTGDGLLLYVGWREGEEAYLFRIEDLVGNVEATRPLPRQRFVYLGSRFLRDRRGEEFFVAGLEQNLVNVAFFPEGNTLLTSSAPICERQDLWAANALLVPPPGSPVRVYFCREPLPAAAAVVAEQLPPLPAGSW